jgi:2'-hydroxyisoflavone reductase
VWADAAFIQSNGLMEKGEVPIWLPPTGPLAGALLVSSARAVKQGLRLRDLDTTVRDTLDWYKKRPADQQKLAAGLTPEREAELLKLLAAKQG